MFFVLFLAKSDPNFFQRVLDFFASIGEMLRSIGVQFVMGAKAGLALIPALSGVLGVLPNMSVSVSHHISLVCSMGIIVAVAAIILPGSLGGKK